MADLFFYSTNPWFATEVASKYRAGMHFAWVSDYFDSEVEAAAGSSGKMIAPSSNPRYIYEQLLHEYRAQEEHPRIIKEYRKTFRRLARTWLADHSIDQNQHDEIVASVQAKSWKVWKPVLYIVPKAGIDPARVVEVPRSLRAGYGPEKQIVDLRRHEFEIIDLSEMRFR